MQPALPQLVGELLRRLGDLAPVVLDAFVERAAGEAPPVASRELLQPPNSLRIGRMRIEIGSELVACRARRLIERIHGRCTGRRRPEAAIQPGAGFRIVARLRAKAQPLGVGLDLLEFGVATGHQAAHVLGDSGQGRRTGSLDDGFALVELDGVAEVDMRHLVTEDVGQFRL